MGTGGSDDLRAVVPGRIVEGVLVIDPGDWAAVPKAADGTNAVEVTVTFGPGDGVAINEAMTKWYA